MKKRLLASTPLDKNNKAILFDLLTRNSKEIKDRDEARNKFTEYFCEVYNKYLIPKELAKDAKRCHKEYIKYINNVSIAGHILFGMDEEYNEEKEGISVSTNNYICFSNVRLIDIEEIYKKNDKDQVDICVILVSKMSEEDFNLLKDLYCSFIVAEWKYKNYMREYRGIVECFPGINTWDALYNLNPEWYDLLYNHLTYYRGKFAGDDDSSDLLSKTKFDREINEVSNIDVLMKKVFNYINE